MEAIFIIVCAFAGFAFLGAIIAPPPRPGRELYERRLRDGPFGRG
ncbi:hypothetical protein LJR219_005025 [Phenylobacterium sp. LjRoot219]